MYAGFANANKFEEIFFNFICPKSGTSVTSY